MSQSVNVYSDGGILFGSGTSTTGSTSITSFTVSAGGPYSIVHAGRNVVVAPTSGTHAKGKSWMTRVVTDGITSLTLAHANPFTD